MWGFSSGFWHGFRKVVFSSPSAVSGLIFLGETVARHKSGSWSRPPLRTPHPWSATDPDVLVKEPNRMSHTAADLTRSKVVPVLPTAPSRGPTVWQSPGV